MRSKDASYEIIVDCECKANNCGCRFEIRICRVKADDGRQGLAAYQKVERHGPGKTPILITHTSHDLFPFL